MFFRALDATEGDAAFGTLISSNESDDMVMYFGVRKECERKMSMEGGDGLASALNNGQRCERHELTFHRPCHKLRIISSAEGAWREICLLLLFVCSGLSFFWLPIGFNKIFAAPPLFKNGNYGQARSREGRPKKHPFY